MADGIPFAIRRNGIHVADRTQGFFQGMKTLRMNAVVIGYQDKHGCISPESQEKEKAIATAIAL